VNATGTPSYRAPELLRGVDFVYTNKVDIWALGCIFYELLFGRKAFAGDFAVREYSSSLELLNIPVTSTILGDVSPWRESIKRIIVRTLHKDPSKRGTARDVRYHIGALAMATFALSKGDGSPERDVSIHSNNNDYDYSDGDQGYDDPDDEDYVDSDDEDFDDPDYGEDPDDSEDGNFHELPDEALDGKAPGPPQVGKADPLSICLFRMRWTMVRPNHPRNAEAEAFVVLGGGGGVADILISRCVFLESPVSDYSRAGADGFVYERLDTTAKTKSAIIWNFVVSLQSHKLVCQFSISQSTPIARCGAIPACICGDDCCSHAKSDVLRLCLGSSCCKCSAWSVGRTIV